MNIKLVVEVELRFVSGKFESREELTQKLIEELESADPGSVTGDNEGEYEVDSFTVREPEALEVTP